MKLSPCLLGLALVCLNACGTPPQENQPDALPGPVLGEPAAPKPPTPWTTSFRGEAILIADVVRIEGPAGLLEHIATRIEPDFHTYEATTLPEGFQQRFEPRDASAGIEMRAYLDNLEVAAFRELVLLERPGDVQVIVEGLGDAYYREAATGDERRGAQLRFVGERPR